MARPLRRRFVPMSRKPQRCRHRATGRGERRERHVATCPGRLAPESGPGLALAFRPRLVALAVVAGRVDVRVAEPELAVLDPDDVDAAGHDGTVAPEPAALEPDVVAVDDAAEYRGVEPRHRLPVPRPRVEEPVAALEAAARV